MNKKYRIYFTLLFVSIMYLHPISGHAEILDYWYNERAYRPAPILFMHGFASGAPEGWDKASGSLAKYFLQYYNPKKVNWPNSLYDMADNYLERIRFFKLNDSTQERLINGNSSIDTYKIGDYYVLKGKRKPGDPGWSDKVNEVVDPILQAYGTNKIIFVCHSMGGLAAREYLRNSGISVSYKVITLGTPHLGAYMASLAKGLRNTQKSGWFCPGNGWILSCLIEGLDIGLELKSKIDADGDAARDMTPDSNFLNTLNSSRQPYNTEFFAIVGNKPGYVGDGVVTVGSQEGQGILQLKDKTIIRATHGEEPQVAAQGNPNPILKFIDCEAPEIEITNPNPNTLEEITELRTNLKGKVRKEYLPADTSLHIIVIREEDASVRTFGDDNSIKLKPSDLWNAQDPDSPIAEFDEEISFWDAGIYTIKVIAKNPSGKDSEEKITRIKVKQDKPFGDVMTYFLVFKLPHIGYDGNIPVPQIDTSFCRFGTISSEYLYEKVGEWRGWTGISIVNREHWFYYRLTITPQNPNQKINTGIISASAYEIKDTNGRELPPIYQLWPDAGGVDYLVFEQWEGAGIADGVKTIGEIVSAPALSEAMGEYGWYLNLVDIFVYYDNIYRFEGHELRSGKDTILQLIPPKGTNVYAWGMIRRPIDEFYTGSSHVWILPPGIGRLY